MAMGSKAYESPLISHARMRALYRGLVETRALAGRRHPIRGLEAAWVATAIDLVAGDLMSDAGAAHEAALLGYIRRIGLRLAGGTARPSDVKRIKSELAAAPELFPGSAADRLLCAAGAAMALKAAGQGRILMAYTAHAALSQKDWKRVLAVMSQAGLPMVLVALPGVGAGGLDLLARKAAAPPGQAVPILPVDAGDVVALYRVAQETIGRARAGGGAAILQTVPMGTDPVRLLGAQLVTKGICTERWVSTVTTQFQHLLTNG